jgi:HD-like signal output (HDOD) protein
VAPIMTLAFEGHISFENAEAQVLGIDHAETGGLLLESWNLPSSIVEAAKFHHCPERAVEDILMTDLIHVADRLSLQAGLGIGMDGLNYHSSVVSAERLGLSDKVTEVVVCQMASGLDQLQDFLGAAPGR